MNCNLLIVYKSYLFLHGQILFPLNLFKHMPNPNSCMRMREISTCVCGYFDGGRQFPTTTGFHQSKNEWYRVVDLVRV